MAASRILINGLRGFDAGHRGMTRISGCVARACCNSGPLALALPPGASRDQFATRGADSSVSSCAASMRPDQPPPSA